MGDVSASGGHQQARPDPTKPAPNQNTPWRNDLSGEVRGSALQAHTIHGDVYFGASSATQVPIPKQLSSSPVHVVGRADDLAKLHELAMPGDDPRSAALVVVAGSGGVGKSALVTHFLQQVRDRYPDGQLYADLQGFGPDEPLSPAEALTRFLRALGVPPDRVPAELAEQVSLYRSLTDGRRLIVMLDNALSAAQVRALLPGPGPSLVAVTTRRRLAGLALDGACFADVFPLDEQAAIELLSRIAGTDRVEAQPDAARSIVESCGRLPLAVSVAAARLALHPAWSLQRAANELANESERLSALSLEGDLSVRAAFDVSYRGLPPDAADAYGLLALIPGPMFGEEVARAAAAAGPAGIARLLDALTGASLLQEVAEQRWRFHDLIRLHALEQVTAGPDADRLAGVTRIVGCFLRMAVAADLVVIPGRWHLGSGYEQARGEPAPFAGPAGALDWLELELPGLFGAVRLAHDHGLHEQAWQLCEALWGLFVNRRPYQHWAEVHRLGLASARECGNRRAQARMHIHLGFADLCLGRLDQARQEFGAALVLDRAEGHLTGEATALDNLGLVSLAAGDPEGALGHFTQARAIHERAGRPRGAALMTRRMGDAQRAAGRYEQAAGYLTDAYRRFTEIGDDYNQARTLTGLAEVLLRSGHPGQALPRLQDALAVMTRLGSGQHTAGIHVLLADVAARLGDSGAERDHLQRALAGYTAIGAPEAVAVRARLEGRRPISGSSSTMPNENGSPAA